MKYAKQYQQPPYYSYTNSNEHRSNLKPANLSPTALAHEASDTLSRFRGAANCARKSNSMATHSTRLSRLANRCASVRVFHHRCGPRTQNAALECTFFLTCDHTSGMASGEHVLVWRRSCHCSSSRASTSLCANRIRHGVGM